MKDRIQERINQIKNLANSSDVKKASNAGFLQTEDSLSKLVRNPKEADMFLAELKTAFQVANDQEK